MTALILVDLQNDFFPGGALAVQKAHNILPVINKLVQMPFDIIAATKDFHPRNHVSFASTHDKKPGDIISFKGIDQILWPEHCIENTYGSEFHTDWDQRNVKKVFYKGTDPEIDSYSTFFDNGHLKSTGLREFLHENHIRKIYLAGLATEYCVKYSALDARRLNFDVAVVKEGCEGVNLHVNDSYEAFEEMKASGIKIVSIEDLEKSTL